MQCRYHATQLGRLYNDFKAANCAILLVLGEPVAKAKRYADSLHLPFPVLADPERMVYHQYGLEKTFVFIQRTASIVIDQKGTIRYMKSTANPLEWLDEIRELFSFVKSMAKDG